MAFLSTFPEELERREWRRIDPTRAYRARLPSGYRQSQTDQTPLLMTNFAVSPAAAPFVPFAHASLLAPPVPGGHSGLTPAGGPFRTDKGIERSHSILAAKQRHADGVERDSRELSQAGQVTKQIDVA